MAVGHEGDALGVGQVGEALGVRQVGVGDDHDGDPAAGEVGDTLLDRTVEAAPGLPQHACPDPGGPVGDVVVVAHHPDRQRGGGPHDRGGHRPGELGPLGRGESPGEAALGVPERLHRDQDGDAPCRLGHGASVGRGAARPAGCPVALP